VSTFSLSTAWPCHHHVLHRIGCLGRFCFFSSRSIVTAPSITSFREGCCFLYVFTLPLTSDSVYPLAPIVLNLSNSSLLFAPLSLACFLPFTTTQSWLFLHPFRQTPDTPEFLTSLFHFPFPFLSTLLGALSCRDHPSINPPPPPLLRGKGCDKHENATRPVGMDFVPVPPFSGPL